MGVNVLVVVPNHQSLNLTIVAVAIHQGLDGRRKMMRCDFTLAGGEPSID